MRTLLMALAVLAIGKVWYQEHTFREAMSDAVVEAYRERAIEVCRRNTLKRASTSREGNAPVWTASASAEAVIGNPDLSVAVWDTQNPLWTQRFRDPHLILTSTTGQRCAYDLRQGGATLTASAQ